MQQLIRHFLAIILFITSYCHPETIGQGDLSLELLRGEPSALVNHSVNAISGQYHELQTDLLSLGPDPLSYERHYASSFCGLGGLCQGWGINNYGQISILNYSDYTDIYMTLYEHGGGSALFEGKYSNSKHKASTLFISSSAIHDGITNTSCGISGKTNIKNHRLSYTEKHGIMKCSLGDGSIRTYKDRNEYNRRTFDMVEEALPDGNRVVYDYTTGSDKRVNKIKLFNKNGKELNSLAITYGKELRDSVKVSTSDNRYVIYDFARYERKYEKHGVYYLSQVKRSDGFLETYQYSKSKGSLHEQLIRKDKPDGRYLINEYYPKNKKSHDDPSYGKIKEQKAPVGVDNTPFTTHRYEYTVNHDHRYGNLINGFTSVWDALNHKTDYHFSFDRRLS